MTETLTHTYYDQGFVPDVYYAESIKTDWIKEEKEWYLLPGTGFDVEKQVDLFSRSIRDGLGKGESHERIVDNWLDQTEQDIQGFKIEYLCEGLLFPIVLEKKVQDGKEQIVAPLYGDKRLLDTVSEEERNGSVKKTIEKVENFLLEAPAGSVALMTSPPGWSGFEGITYPDTQTYIWQVQEDGNIRGFTVRTDMDHEQNKQLLETFGMKKENLNSSNEHEELTNIVSHPVFLSGEEKKCEIEDVVDVIQKIKGENAYKDRGFDEVYSQLENPEQLWTLDNTTRELVTQFREYVWDQIQNGTGDRKKNIQKMLGVTVLKLAEKIRKIPSQHEELTVENSDIFWMDERRYQGALQNIQQLGGCNGGGSDGRSVMINSVTPRFGVISTENKKTLSCTCPFCNKRVEALIEGGKITCTNPTCKKSAPYNC
jgi:hypothetical protein